MRFQPGQPRPPGAGRRKGSLNKKTKARKEQIEQIKASGSDPITFFADLLKNPDHPLELRFNAAKELAPYMHPKLSSIEASNGAKTHEQRLEDMRKMLAEEEEPKLLTAERVPSDTGGEGQNGG